MSTNPRPTPNPTHTAHRQDSLLPCKVRWRQQQARHKNARHEQFQQRTNLTTHTHRTQQGARGRLCADALSLRPQKEAVRDPSITYLLSTATVRVFMLCLPWEVSTTGTSSATPFADSLTASVRRCEGAAAGLSPLPPPLPSRVSLSFMLSLRRTPGEGCRRRLSPPSRSRDLHTYHVGTVCVARQRRVHVRERDVLKQRQHIVCRQRAGAQQPSAGAHQAT